MANRKIVNMDTGEVEPTIIVDRRKKKIMYSEWYAVNQEKEVEVLKNSELSKSLYTTKGRVYHYLMSRMEYGNFTPFIPKHIAKELGITTQALYKARRELVEDGLILLAKDEATGVKGVLFTNAIVQKGQENPHIKVLEDES